MESKEIHILGIVHIDSDSQETAGIAGLVIACPTVVELFPEISDASLDEDDALPSCSAMEALKRQEPFINQVLAYQALAMLARLGRAVCRADALSNRSERMPDGINKDRRHFFRFAAMSFVYGAFGMPRFISAQSPATLLV